MIKMRTFDLNFFRQDEVILREKHGCYINQGSCFFQLVFF